MMHGHSEVQAHVLRLLSSTATTWHSLLRLLHLCEPRSTRPEPVNLEVQGLLTFPKIAGSYSSYCLRWCTHTCATID